MMHAETEAGFAKERVETRDGLEKKTGESDQCRASVDKLAKELKALPDAPMRNDGNVKRLEQRVTLDRKAVAHFATLLKNHRST